MIRTRDYDPATRDLLATAAFTIAALVLFHEIEAFERLHVFVASHEHWEADELVTTFLVLPFALVTFAWRRWRETGVELARRIEAETEAQLMALHDPLTGLPNRRQAESAIVSAIARALDEPFALMMIDVNRFKSINDLYGHAAGDALLLEIGRRLTKGVGRDGAVARLGGDEFTVLMGGHAGEALINRVEQIAQLFEDPFDFGHGQFSAGVSIGVTLITETTLSVDDALSRADAAMYRCKNTGRNGFAFFEAGMEFAAQHRAQLESDLRLAIRESRIEPFYQPLISLDGGGICGFEVLARWCPEDGAVRMPDEFIPIAEKCGLISDLYYCILAKAAPAVRSWPADWRFAVNLSPLQFSDEWLVERTLQILTAAGVSPGRLDIEITESALVANIDDARRVIEKLKSQGITIVLDDFGTGYSSLRHLSELKFDKLKIDRSFLKDLPRNATSRTIVRTVTAMAHNLGLSVTAEGVESPEVEAQLRAFGCDTAQGYLYGKPAATPKIEAWQAPSARGSDAAARPQPGWPGNRAA